MFGLLGGSPIFCKRSFTIKDYWTSLGFLRISHPQSHAHYIPICIYIYCHILQIPKISIDGHEWYSHWNIPLISYTIKYPITFTLPLGHPLHVSTHYAWGTSTNIICAKGRAQGWLIGDGGIFSACVAGLAIRNPNRFTEKRVVMIHPSFFVFFGQWFWKKHDLFFAMKICITHLQMSLLQGVTSLLSSNMAGSFRVFMGQINWAVARSLVYWLVEIVKGKWSYPVFCGLHFSPMPITNQHRRITFGRENYQGKIGYENAKILIEKFEHRQWNTRRSTRNEKNGNVNGDAF